MFNFYIKIFNFKNKKIENIFKCTLNLCLSSYMHAYKQNLHNKWKGPKLGYIYIYDQINNPNFLCPREIPTNLECTNVTTKEKEKEKRKCVHERKPNPLKFSNPL